MPYCIIADIELTPKELIQLCDDNVPLVATAESLTVAIAGGDMSGFSEAIQAATATVLANINKAIAHADTLINGHVGERYQLPFDAAPALIKTIAMDITTWRIYFRKKKDKLPETVQAAYDNSMKLLGQIRDGKISIGVTPAGTAVKPEASGGIQIAATKPVFTNDVMERF